MCWTWVSPSPSRGQVRPAGQYKVAAGRNIPDAAKDADGAWFSDYGGYVAIGYDPAR